MRKAIFCILCTVLLIFKTNSQIENSISSEINMQKKDNFIVLKAEVENESILYKDELSYNFIALKKEEKGNYSNNKQEGKFSLKPQESKELAVIRVNLSEKEELRTYLFIKYKDRLASKDSIWIGSNTNQVEVEKNNEKDFFIKGIVIDEAITKIGKDFHDYFYQNYLLSGRKYPFIITVKEKPSFGRSSIISVEVEDLKIHEFLSKPNEEYLKDKVRIVLERISVYDKRRNALLKASKI